MRKSVTYLVLSLIFVIVAASLAMAAVTAATNMAAGKSSIGTFNNVGAITDGVISAKKAIPATSNLVADSNQYLTVDLGNLVYVDRVKVYFDAAAYPKNFAVKTSGDAKFWEVEAAGLDASTGASDAKDGVVFLTVSCKRALIGARYVQIEVPAGAALSGGQRVRVSEIQVFPAMGQKLSIEDKNAYAVTDKLAVIRFKTSIGAVAGKVLFGTSPNVLAGIAPNQESGVDNSATIYGLKPGTTYYYKAQATDLYGNAVESDLGVFTTLNTNVAGGKAVSGTFTAIPADPFVDKTKPALARVTDSSTSYFTAMAQSLNVNDSDQYVTIDLGRDYPIKSIQTYWRKLAYPEDYSILVSSDNANWRTIAQGVNADSGAFSRSDTGDPMQVVAVSPSDVSARYVKVLVPKGSAFYHKHADWNFVQLMEVRVFSD